VRITPKNGTRIVEVIGFTSDPAADGSVRVPAGDIYGGRVTDVLVRLATAAAQPVSAADVVAVDVAYTPAQGGARMSEQRVLVAGRSADAHVVEGALVGDVAVKVEKFHAAQAWLTANAAYDRGDKAAGDAIMDVSTKRLAQQAAKLNATELAKEASEQEEYKVQNEQGGAGWRALGTRAAKKKAWSMNKGSAY
jgi:hypothetical protein